MRIDVVESEPATTASTAEALERFEASFTYPLGAGRRFRISHGHDYSRFFRSLGRGACFIARRDDEVLGVIGVALRRVVTAAGAVRQAAYFGDLKIAPTARGGRVLVGLAAAVRQWIGDRADAAYGVVMDETSVLPTGYTGRAGIPSFSPAAHFTILRIPTTMTTSADDDPVVEIDPASWFDAVRRLTAGANVSVDGDVALRTVAVPRKLATAAGDAAGELADTAAAKRLYADDDVEMRSAHLASLVYSRIEAAMALIRRASELAAEAGFPAMFVAVPDRDADRIRRSLPAETAVAGATVYTYGFPTGGDWLVSTCEI
jgi:hypothetical protein